MRVSKAERAESIATLRQSLKPGDTVTCVLRSVSRSGMSRRIDFYKFEPDASIGFDNGVRTLWLTFHIGRALGYSLKDDALDVSGCGMDMGFHVVYSLASVLWPDGFECIGDKCPSNEHTNGGKRRKGKLHGKGGGGYALRSRWL